VAVFADAFDALACGLGRKLRAQGRAVVRILDATPIPLGQLFACASWNGRIKGFKLHLAFDPTCERPRVLAITQATVNDITPARAMALERGVLHVFDKGYCSFGWWADIAQNGAFFVTRPKANMSWDTLETRPVNRPAGDGFTVLAGREARLASKGDSKLPMRLRLITVKPDAAKAFNLLTNDMRRSARTIAALYKQRWQIKLLFRWLKQHLKLRTFLGRGENAIRLQILSAMIAYVLIKLAARRHRTTLQDLRFAELVALCLFETRPIAAIARPLPEKRRRKNIHPAKRANHA
jgi:putative transposase